MGNNQSRKLLNIVKHKMLIFMRQRGIRLVNSEQLRALQESGLSEIVARWTQEDVPEDLLDFVYRNYQKSHSQLQQDVVALYYNQKSPRGTIPFYVEFGATDGVTLSNSYLLEKEGWKGLLAEPDRNWHKKLSQNRSAPIDKRCVYSISGESVPFRESEIGELSGIVEFADNDGWSDTRSLGTIQEVETVSLQDLLVQNHAPRQIDFLSIDTEGSEYSIIQDFDFSYWDIRLVVIEHNFTSSKGKIIEKMLNSGYLQILPKISAWDAWFLKVD